MYTFVSDISASEFNDFVSTYSGAPVEQTAAWAELKDAWQHTFCGIYSGRNIVGAALVLIRRIAPGIKLAYCPRGPLIDFSDREAVKAFADGIRELCRKKGICAALIDPPLVMSVTLPEGADVYTKPFAPDAEAFKNILSSGFTHRGFHTGFEKTLQPRYNAFIPLRRSNGERLDMQGIIGNFKPKIRPYFASFARLRGMYFERAEATDGNISLLREVISGTEKRQRITLRNEAYFARMSRCFGEDMLLGFEKCDINEYIKNLSEKGEAEKARVASDVMAERGERVTLSASVTLLPPNKSGIRTAEFLYAGSDLSIFRSFSASAIMIGEVCRECMERDIDYLDFGGVDGRLEGGLYNFKKQFSPVILEYAGEFVTVVNRSAYATMQSMLSLGRSWNKLKKKIRK